MSTDPVADSAPATEVQPAASGPVEPPAAPAQPAEATAAAPAGSSAAPAPEPTPEPEPASSPAPSTPEPAAAAPNTTGGPPPGQGRSTAAPVSSGTDVSAGDKAKAEAKAVLESKSPDLATLLSVVAPGSGHLYLGVEPAKRNIAFGLLGASVVAVILAYLSFILFIVGFVIWAAAALFAVNDLRGGVKGLENSSIPQQFVGILLVASGIILILSLILPWYHVTVDDVGGFGGGSGSFNGFESLEIIDLVLLVVGVAAVVAGLASMGIGVPADKLPTWLPMAVAIGGAVAFVLILFRMFVDVFPETGDGVKIGRAPGILLAADAAIVLVMANLSALKSLRR
jgi:hypothetical protein